MVIKKKSIFQTVLWGALIVAALAPVMIPAQEDDPATVDVSDTEDPVQETIPHPNPTQRFISPRNQQSKEQQLSDEWECYDQACDQTDWDPYQAYAILVDQGYVTALTREELEEGWICQATEGAVTGAVAGDMVGMARRGAEIGAAIALASELVRSGYIDQVDDPEARRSLSRFERNLRHWDRKFAACLRPKGYRVTSP